MPGPIACKPWKDRRAVWASQIRSEMKGWLGERAAGLARGAAARVNSVAAAVSAASDRADSALARFQAEHDDAAAEGESAA